MTALASTASSAAVAGPIRREQAVPQSTPEPLTSSLVAMAIVLVASAVEIGLAWMVVLNPSAVGTGLLAHVAVAATLVLWLTRLRRAGRLAARGELLFVLSTAALGPVGACGALCSNALRRSFAKNAHSSPKAWHATLANGADADPAHKLRRNIAYEAGAADDRSGVAPFADVMAHGSLEQKQAVIALIAGKFQPGFAPPLLAAMNDAEPTVRVMAATAAATIENQFLESSMALEQKRTANVADVAATIELARHYDNYANTGLLDDGRTKSARCRALNLYREADRQGPGYPEVLNAIIRLLVRLGRESEAIEPFGALVANGTAAPESFVWYVECLFRLGRFETLRRTCARFDATTFDKSRLSARCQQALGLWAASAQSR